MRMVPVALLESFIADLKRDYENACGDSSIGFHIAEDLEDLVKAATVRCEVW